MKLLVESNRPGLGEAPRPTIASRRLPALDGLRGLLFVAVFIGHANIVRNSGFGSLAMFPFFALSGFLLTALAIGERDKTNRVDLKRFFARRAIRLVPALVAMLSVWMLVMIIAGRGGWTTTVPGGGNGAPQSLLAAIEGVGAGLAYLTNWVTIIHGFSGYVALGHLWSLAVEEQFYLIWIPILAYLLGRRSRSVAAVTAGMLALASIVDVGVLSARGASGVRIQMGTDTRAAAFLLGGLGAFAWCASRWPIRGGPHVGAVIAALGTALLLGALDPLRHPGGSGEILGYVLASCGSALLVVGIAEMSSSGLKVPLLSSPVARYLGSRSYALYLWHYLWLTWLRQLGLVGVLGAFVATLACAEASWRIVELPAARLRRYVSARPAKTTTTGRILIDVPARAGAAGI